MRSYKASRRRALKETIDFQVEYVASERDEDGHLVEVDKVETFTCKGEISSLVLSELAFNADANTATPEGMGVLRQVFSSAFGDEHEYNRFFRFAAKHLDDDDLMDIMSDLIEDFTGRPTEQSSSSQPERSTTGQTSKVVTLPGGFTVAAPAVPGEVVKTEDLPQASSI